jgi:hypothetical protein
MSMLKVVPVLKVTLPLEISSPARPALLPGATDPLVAVMPPTVPVPPSVPPVTFIRLLAVLPFISKVPALTIVVPV